MGEVRIDPLGAKPSFLFAPAQAFLQQEELAQAAALDGDLLVLVQLSGQPIQAPAVKGQVKFAGPLEGGGSHLRAFLRRVGGGRP